MARVEPGTDVEQLPDTWGEVKICQNFFLEIQIVEGLWPFHKSRQKMKATVLILVFLTVSSFAEDLYVEETGENEIIPIEETEIHKIVKRQKGDYSYDDDEDYTDFESSGDEGLYDLDTYDDEDQYEAGQPVMPSRVIPPLISPSFDDYGNVVSTPIVLSKSALDVLKTSLYIEDDLEGSGNDDFASTIGNVQL